MLQRQGKMSSRDRTLSTFAHVQPDFPPCDYFATPEIEEALMRVFKVKSDSEIREILGTDIRYINPPYIGPPLPTFDDGSEMDIWGIRKKPMPNEYGDYAEPINYPYANWESVDDAANFTWPSANWFDYEVIPAMCEQYRNLSIATGGFDVQDFINSVAFGRGVEQVLIDIALEHPVYLYIIEKRHRFYLEVVERTLKAANGRIDFVMCGDDFGTQRGLLLAPTTFDRLFAQKKKELFDLVHSYGAVVSHHSCGSTRKLIPRFIEIGMDALQTIQPKAAGMNPYELKKTFRNRITLHGAVDVQGWLQHSSSREIRKEIFQLLEEVGKGGGYILSPTHYIQPDTPIENVLAVYQAVLEFRGIKVAWGQG